MTSKVLEIRKKCETWKSVFVGKPRSKWKNLGKKAWVTYNPEPMANCVWDFSCSFLYLRCLQLYIIQRRQLIRSSGGVCKHKSGVKTVSDHGYKSWGPQTGVTGDRKWMGEWVRPTEFLRERDETQTWTWYIRMSAASHRQPWQLDHKEF